MAPRGKRSSPEPGLPKSFDPYLRYAIATEFKTFESFEEGSTSCSFSWSSSGADWQLASKGE